MKIIELQVNGTKRRIEVEAERSLLSVLRDDLDLTGAKYGCGEGQCGACTVLVDGQPARSCIAKVGAIEGKQITTIEGLQQNGRLHPLQEAFLEADAMQCGYCITGMIMSGAGLLKKNPHPTEQEMIRAMEGNMCRCGTYPRIVAAIRQVANGAKGQKGRAPGSARILRADYGQAALAACASFCMLEACAPRQRTEGLIDEISSEPERYELAAGPTYHFELARRDFFKVLGGGILIAFTLNEALAQQESGGGRRRGFGGQQPQEIGAWLHIGEDGAVTVYTGKVEVGQNARTSLTQVVAEELRAPLASVRLVMGDTDLTPFDAGTFGSRTTPSMSPQLRKVAAAARELLIDLAAEQMRVERSSLVAADGRIAHPPTKQSFSFGQLTKGQKLMKAIGESAPVTPPDRWKIAGKAVPKINGRAIVTGKHQYTSDIKRPGLLYGRVLRPAAFSATLASIDTREAESPAGVAVVRDGDFVGVAAPSQQMASRAVAAIRAEWKTTPQPSANELFDYLKKQPVEAQGFEGRSGDTRGSIAEGLAAADQKLERTYTVAYIAHAPLEPRAAVAEWENGKLTVWTGTQRPFGVRSELAGAFRIPEDRIRVIVPDTGSGYGGKHTGEAALEAARLAKAAGKPVKLVWTREEEFTWAYFRPAGVIEITSGVSKDGTITAWEFHNYNSGASGIRPLYDIPHQRIEFHPARSPLRQGSYRALAATANHFAREVHINEMAQSLKMDPLEFRFKNLKDERLRAVLDTAAKAFGWGNAKDSPDRGYGIAVGFEKGGYLANCVEVSVDRSTGKVKIVRVAAAFECGAIINPDHLKNQIEGAIVQGIGGALFEAIEFEDGKILNPRFSRYRVPRFSDVPILETVLIDRMDLPSAGAGETPIVALAPAVSNAVFDATGVRLRSLPMVPNGLKA